MNGRNASSGKIKSVGAKINLSQSSKLMDDCNDYLLLEIYLIILSLFSISKIFYFCRAISISYSFLSLSISFPHSLLISHPPLFNFQCHSYFLILLPF